MKPKTWTRADGFETDHESKMELKIRELRETKQETQDKTKGIRRETGIWKLNTQVRSKQRVQVHIPTTTNCTLLTQFTTDTRPETQNKSAIQVSPKAKFYSFAWP